MKAPSLDVLRDIAAGHDMNETATRVGVSVDVIKYHLRCWRDRLGARNTTHAVALATTAGLIGTTKPGCHTCERTRRLIAAGQTGRARFPDEHYAARLYDHLAAIHTSRECT